ncbi:ThiF family adenylyltransferase [Jeotgalibacillus campisalis]|uniref:Thiamine/molybdopterin biosynthesis ThiF/MoeB-like protein n=1 Tax=Jeotgalibacillus campisalis TaxID=220754 RepID=A0A0C2W4D5_9BACL|nr:ThiF family adenylyltransferase [Jeotgalibacillus campisalis]KIL50913.1 thiamine/molybdopterin biosynthesis ThiF/MoeB-like protein [Jeotgalibacillus campisalis]
MNERYSRQELFAPIGVEGQRKIGDKHVLLIGLGALGSSAADMLVRAGIGKLTIVDRDYVDWSNLGRQLLYHEEDAANHLPKAIAAQQKLKKINSEVEVTAHIMDVTGPDLEELLQKGEIDLILDGTDQFDIRLLINDAAQKYAVPWIYGACVGSYGMSYTILPGDTPCLHCLLQKLPLQGPTCDTNGVISPIVHVVTAHQVTEALKICTGDLSALRKELVTFDLWNYRHQAFRVEKMKKDNCPSCGVNPTYPYLQQRDEFQLDVLCGRDTIQIRPLENNDRDLNTLEALLQEKEGKTIRNEYLLVHQAEHRLVFFKDGRVLVHGTKDRKKAAELYQQLVT